MQDGGRAAVLVLIPAATIIGSFPRMDVWKLRCRGLRFRVRGRQQGATDVWSPIPDCQEFRYQGMLEELWPYLGKL